jgi:hypothetical protein
MKQRHPLSTMGGVSERSGHRRGRAAPYRIVVRGQLGRSFVGPLSGMSVESVAAESSLRIDIVDQSHLQSVLQALADRGIEIVGLHVAADEDSGSPGILPPARKE